MGKVPFSLWEILLIIAASTFNGFVWGAYVFEIREQHRMMNQAVERGHARFYLDEKNVRCWEWLPACRK